MSVEWLKDYPWFHTRGCVCTMLVSFSLSRPRLACSAPQGKDGEPCAFAHTAAAHSGAQRNEEDGGAIPAYPTSQRSNEVGEVMMIMRRRVCLYHPVVPLVTPTP